MMLRSWPLSFVKASSSGSPRSRSAARSNAMRSTSWPGTRATPRPSQKRAAGPPEAPEGGAGPGHAGQGEAADLRDDPAVRGGDDPDAGGRQAGDDRPSDQADDHTGGGGL